MGTTTQFLPATPGFSVVRFSPDEPPTFERFSILGWRIDEDGCLWPFTTAEMLTGNDPTTKVWAIEQPHGDVVDSESDYYPSLEAWMAAHRVP